MPIFEVETPDGKILEIEGEQAPSEAELNEIFASVDEPKKGIDLTPSGISKTISAAITAPIRMATKGESYTDAFKNTKSFLDKNMDTRVGDFAAYYAIPGLKAAQNANLLGKAGKFVGDAALQGGVPDALEAAKRGENSLEAFLTGSVIAGGIQGLPALKNIPKLGNAAFKNLFPGLKPKTVEQLIKPNSQALDLTEDTAQNLLMNTTERVQNDYKDILRQKGEQIGAAIDNLDANAGVPINKLKADLNDIYDSYSKSGDNAFNKAYNEAGDIYDNVIETLQKGEIPQAQIDKENFIDFYNKMLKGEINPTKRARILSQTPDIWLQQGVPNQSIVTSQNILKKMGSEPNIYDKNHNISADTIRKLPDLLFDPNYILKSNTQSGRYVGVLNETDDLGRPILGILDPNGGVNFMPSAYGRNNFDDFIKDQEKLGNILYNKGVTPSTPTIGVEQGTPITSIADLPKNDNISAKKLYEYLHGGMPKIKWDEVNADIKNSILERISGKYRSRLSKLSPELKEANKEYAKVKNFQKNEGLNTILNPKNLKNENANKLDTASQALRNYNSTITSGNKNRNIQNLEEMFINEGKQPFLNDIDDVNAANELLKTAETGINPFGLTDKMKNLVARPTLRMARGINRMTEPIKEKFYEPLKNVSPAILRALIPAATTPLLYGGVTND